ncbi:MaoC family dehydratase [Amycolatopsis deserti]|uniref:MaoC family dehydratase n=1 Tax=Amycolatopsis deserti TaxID=185696 RepID=A0ABQ3IPV2_9PSEU|nr:MaoC family dehydratase [Amycolatopsis deserti]GHE88693.1 MaoC family dehydratase [Amycolatopsis deserti]
MRVFRGIEELEGAVGTHLGYSEWHTITQEQIDAFAESTGDHQWIHTDPVRAAEGPFGTTVAHGYLTLSLVPMLLGQIFTVEGFRAAVNYGANRLRFPAPAPAGSRVRAGAELVSVTAGSGGWQLVHRVTIERDRGGKPACVVETVSVVTP